MLPMSADRVCGVRLNQLARVGVGLLWHSAQSLVFSISQREIHASCGLCMAVEIGGNSVATFTNLSKPYHFLQLPVCPKL